MFYIVSSCMNQNWSYEFAGASKRSAAISCQVATARAPGLHTLYSKPASAEVSQQRFWLYSCLVMCISCNEAELK